jgi:hypothetical protein
MIDINKISELSKVVEIDESAEGTSAYGVWKIAEEVFETLGLEFSAKSQTFYNYAKSGKINGTKDSRGRFSDDEIELFIAKLVAAKTR